MIKDILAHLPSLYCTSKYGQDFQPHDPQSRTLDQPLINVKAHDPKSRICVTQTVRKPSTGVDLQDLANSLSG